MKATLKTIFAKGGPFIGLTGKDAYAAMGDQAGQDLLVGPQLAEEPIFALEFTILWWEGHVPDSYLGDERKVRRVVNGGYFGLAEVEKLADNVRKALAVT